MDANEQRLSIEYELVPEDFVAFQKHFSKHSQTGRKKSHWRWILMSLVLVVLTLNFFSPKRISGDNWWIWLVGLLFLWAVFYVMANREQNRRVHQMFEDGSNKLLFGKRMVYITPDEFSESSMFCQTILKWAGIQNLVTTADHLFVYISTTTAFVVPRRAFRDESSFKTFSETAMAYYKAVSPGLCRKCGYDLTGNTSGRCPECGESFEARDADANEELAGWSFDVDEVSAGVYRVEGSDAQGRSVQATGADPDALLKDCKKKATSMMQST